MPQPDFIFNRPIKDFLGDNVVIGCSHHGHCRSQLHQEADGFYTIDINEVIKPDFVFDIMGKLPNEFNNRFKLVMVEHITYIAYNDDPPERGKEGFINTSGQQGFNNIWSMTADNGFIIIMGCPQIKEFRHSVHSKSLKYIEVNEGHYQNSNAAILIPKNQDLSIVEVRNQIALNPLLVQLISDFTEDNKNVAVELTFCNKNYEEMFLNYEILVIRRVKELRDQKMSELFLAIRTLSAYGNQLRKEDPEKGEMVLSLGRALHAKANAFFVDDRNFVFSFQDASVSFRDVSINMRSEQSALSTLMNEFNQLLNDPDTNEKMAEHRKYWKPLLANIVIGLTAIGTLAVAGKLLYSKATTGHYALFFTDTTRQKLLAEVKRTTNNLLNDSNLEITMKVVPNHLAPRYSMTQVKV